QMERNEAFFVKNFNRRKNKARNTAIALAFILALWLGGSFIKNYTEPPYTDGMTPREVVETFYEGINGLDIIAIDGTTDKKAGKFISDQVSTIYVITKNKQAYSPGGTLSPEDWEAQGFPPLESGEIVYGISDLTIEDRGNNIFQASYLVWYPPTEDMENPGTYKDLFDIYSKKEVLTVVRDRRDRSWIIGAFSEVESRNIPSREILPPKE
ncbi:MAG: hypothetical protein PQJ60_05555, partial [Spirochaetales bacterium]|nr:hypothetical protein [Spirochaetales bacterium]